MNAKTLYALIAVAAISLVVAIWINTSNAPVSEASEKDQLLLPGLRDQLNDIDSMVVQGASAKVLTTLKRNADGSWGVAEKSGYAADLPKLREFLLKLAEATVIEAKTANPKRYAELGVDDVTAADAKSLLLTLGGTKPPVKLIIGLFNGAGGGGTFVRRAEEAASFLVKGNLLVEKDAAAWIRHDLIDIDSVRIKDVVLTAPDGKILHAYKEQSADNNFKVADLPKGRELASDFVANSLGSGLASLRADDVAAAKDTPIPDKVYKARYLAFGGLVVDVTAWEAAGKNQVQLAASNDAAQVDADITAVQAKAKAAYETAVASAKLKVVEAKGDAAAIAAAESQVPKPSFLADPDKDRAERRAAADKVVADLNHNFRGWTFSVPAYAFANFNKGMDAMLKPLSDKLNKDPPGADKSGSGNKPALMKLPSQGSPPRAPAPAHG